MALEDCENDACLKFVVFIFLADVRQIQEIIDSRVMKHFGQKTTLVFVDSNKNVSLQVRHSVGQASMMIYLVKMYVIFCAPTTTREILQEASIITNNKQLYLLNSRTSSYTIRSRYEV